MAEEEAQAGNPVDKPVKIPKFEGKTVHAARLAFSGSVDSDLIVHDDSEVTFIVRGKVGNIKHGVDSFGVRRRVQSITVAHAIEADEVSVRRVLDDLKRVQDEAAGQTSLDTDIDGATDAPE